MDKKEDQNRSMKLLKEMNNIQDQYIQDAAEDLNRRYDRTRRRQETTGRKKHGKIRPYILTAVITAAATLFLTSAVVIGLFSARGMGSAGSSYSAAYEESAENPQVSGGTYYSAQGTGEGSDAPADNAYDQLSTDTYNGTKGNGQSSSSDGNYTSEEAVSETSPSGEEGVSRSGSSDGEESSQSSGRKLIYTVNYSVETKDMDQLLQTLKQSVQKLGGYIESSDFSSDRSYQGYSESADKGDSDRPDYQYAYLTIRIPAGNLDEFRSIIHSDSNVTDETMSTEDVTLQYVDTESHRIALEAEEKRLLEMMDKAETVDEMIQIEDKLADIRYQLEDINSQLKLYDNQIDYSTVNISITRTENYTVTDENQTWQEKIASGFSRSIHSVGEHFTEFGIAFAINLPMILYVIFWIVILILIVFLVVRVIRRIIRRHRRRIWQKDGNGSGEDNQKSEGSGENAADSDRDSAASDNSTDQIR